VVIDTVPSMLATNDSAMNVIVVAAAVVGPLLAIAIFWFGLRHARKHDA
jgi:high-affinity Fe2+/Pb2+ permease